MPKQQQQLECSMSAHARTRSSTRAASRASLSAPLRAVAGAPSHQSLPSPRSLTHMQSPPPQQQFTTMMATMHSQQQHHHHRHEPMDDDGESMCSYSSGDSADGYDSQHYTHDAYDSQRHSHTHSVNNSTYSNAQHAPVTHAMASTAPNATFGAELLAPYAQTPMSSRVAPAAVPATARKTYKPRKATHVVRREEKEELERQIERLQAELLGLKYRAMFPDLHTSSSSSSGAQASSSRLNAEFTGDVLRDAIKIQQLSLASVQAVISSYVRLHKVSPIHTPIRLGRDVAKRKLALQALKDAKLAEAKRFLTERTRGMDMTKLFSEEERFETDDGDYCVLQLDITPLPKAKSVKALFDVLFYFIFNLEIKITEALGNITIREDDESGDETIAHHRFASISHNGVPLEVSTVHFSDFRDLSGAAGGAAPDGGSSGMIVADFVDDDELYPYRPMERIRQDLTAILTITPERKRVTNAQGVEHDEVVVTLTRWMVVRSHRPQFPIDDDRLLAVRSCLGTWTDEMLKAVRQKAASSSRS